MEVDGKVDAPTAAGEDDDDIIFIEDEERNPLDGPVGGPATPLELPDVSFFLINKGTNIDIVHGLAMINPEAMTPIKKKVTLKVKSDDPPSLQALSLNPEIEIRPGPKFTKKKVTLIIDSVAKKTCINTSCPKKSESFCDATSMMLDIYYVNKSKKKQSICEDCFDKAYEQINDFARQFIEGKPIITVKRPEKPDLVEIIDSDEEGDAATSGDEKSKFFIVVFLQYLILKCLGDEYEPIKNITALLNLNFAAMLEDFNEKFDIQKQYDLSVAHFNKSLDENEGIL